MSDEFTGKTDRDILIQNSRDICWIKKILGNHLEHHKSLTIALIGLAGGLVFTLVGAIISLIVVLVK